MSTPNTLLSTSRGAATMRCRAPLASRCGNGNGTWLDVRLVDQLSAHATRQAILVDLDACLLRHRELRCQDSLSQADAGDNQAFLRRVIEADAAEIDRQMLLERSDDDLKDALDILPLADGPGDLLKQIEARQLSLQLASSASLRSVMSRDNLRGADDVPVRSRSGEIVTDTSMVRPSFAIRTVSK